MSATPKLRPLRDFALLHEDWYEDDVLHAIAEETTPMVFAYVAMLIGRCRRRSHVEDNPEGWVQLTVKQAARMLSDEPGVGESSDAWLGTRMAMWADLHEGEIVEIEGEIAGRFRTRLINFRKYQTPRGSATERTRALRLRAGENPSQGTEQERDGNTQEQSETHRDRDRDRDREEENTSTSGKPKRDTPIEARQVFDHWVKTWNKRADVSFEGKRKAAVVARLKKYTVQQLCDAITGYTYSEHHNGSNGKKYDELELFMRDAIKVDAGLDHFAARRGIANGVSAAHCLATADLVRIERAIGRDLTGDEEAALQAGTRTVEAFLADQGITAAGAA